MNMIEAVSSGFMSGSSSMMTTSMSKAATSSSSAVTEASGAAADNSFERLFDAFCAANTSKSILKCFDQMCHVLHIDQEAVYEHGLKGGTHLIYPCIKQRTGYWKANDLWKKYDKKASAKAYKRDPNKFKHLNVLIIGCGPVGLRLSIECAFLGHRCTIVEKRDRYGSF